jgi:D-alanine-D-alanine ligase
MMTRKKSVLVLFGGRSPEHDVSIVTALQVLNAIDPEFYEAIPVYISFTGQWLTGKPLLQRSTYIPGADALKELVPVSLHIGAAERPHLVTQPRSILQRSRSIGFDVAIPSFHGPVGEDGRVQGLLEVAGIPYTGMRTFASALFMDKVATKRMIADTGIPQLSFKKIRRPVRGVPITPSELQKQFGGVDFPCCVKPAHLGSSIGVARIASWEELANVLPTIFRYDDTAIIEPFVPSLVEYNVAVCRVEGRVTTSAIERPKHTSEFHDFKAKYLSGSNAAPGIKVPGQIGEGMPSLTRDINPSIPAQMERDIRDWASKAFTHLDGTGAPRMDFLCNSMTGEVWFNEVNPCPGLFGYFLWEAAAKPIMFSELLELLIAEAFDLHGGTRLPADPTPKDARLFPRRG